MTDSRETIDLETTNGNVAGPHFRTLSYTRLELCQRLEVRDRGFIEGHEPNILFSDEESPDEGEITVRQVE